MTDSVNKGMEADVIYLYFSKALVTVSQSIFLVCLGRYGFSRVANELNWQPQIAQCPKGRQLSTMFLKR